MKVSITYKNKEKDGVKVSVSEDDLWDCYVTLARVIYPLLKKYRKRYDNPKKHHSYPTEFSSDLRRLDRPDDPEKFNEWLQCLDKMVYSFECIAKNRGWDGPAQKEYCKEAIKLMALHKKELEELREKDKERRRESKEPAIESLELNRRLDIIHPLVQKFEPQFQEHHRKVQEGIDLFAKYFDSLWL